MTKGSQTLLVLLLAAAVPAFAQAPAGPPAQAASPTAGAPASPVPWSNLSSDQQRLLGKFSGNWNNLPAERQQALARGSNRWLAMTPDQRGQAQQRFQKWHALPPAQQHELRNRWQHFQSLPPDQQAAVRQNFHRFKQLPPERRQMLRERWRNASPAERQMMIQRAHERQQMRDARRAAHAGSSPTTATASLVSDAVWVRPVL